MPMNILAYFLLVHFNTIASNTGCHSINKR